MHRIPVWILSLAALAHLPAAAAALPPTVTASPATGGVGKDVQPAPLACMLQGNDRERQLAALRELRDTSRSLEELPDGYAFVFNDDTAAAALLQVVLAERRCCPFFTFELILPADLGPVTLRVHGPTDAKAFIRDLLGGEAPAR